MDVPSPCISICRINDASGHCEGCGRTLDEIAMWPLLPDSDKKQLLEELKLRKSKVD